MNLVDLSQIISACVYMGDAHECAKHPSIQSKGMIKHSILNSIRANHMMHKQKYGKMVLACDWGSWRYDVFPQYKHSRKIKRANDTSGINWDFVEEVKVELINELYENFPFVVLRIPKCEGDDIIAVLTELISTQVAEEDDVDLFGDAAVEQILITSTDQDNFQLHKWKNVHQYSPAQGKMLKCPGKPRNHLLEKIVKGDPGDGVMNIKMADNTFVDGVRQKPISQVFLDKFFAAEDPLSICEDEIQRTNFIRNEQLVSYEKIPKEIKDKIIACYNENLQKKHSKMQLMNYLVGNKMTNLLSQIHDFY